MELLARLGVAPDAIDPADIDETPAPHEPPRIYAERMAREKASAVAVWHPNTLVLAADTVVAVGRRILPKAENAADVEACLMLLSGRRHRVLSAVTLIDTQGRARHRLSETVLAFKRLSPPEIAAYVARGDGLGKAGGYAIQGYAESFVRLLQGSHSGVMGLPLFETRALLISAGWPLG